MEQKKIFRFLYDLADLCSMILDSVLDMKGRFFGFLYRVVSFMSLACSNPLMFFFFQFVMGREYAFRAGAGGVFYLHKSYFMFSFVFYPLALFIVSLIYHVVFYIEFADYFSKRIRLFHTPLHMINILGGLIVLSFYKGFTFEDYVLIFAEPVRYSLKIIAISYVLELALMIKRKSRSGEYDPYIPAEVKVVMLLVFGAAFFFDAQRLIDLNINPRQGMIYFTFGLVAVAFSMRFLHQYLSERPPKLPS